MKQNLKFIEIENDVVTISDVMFELYHVQHLKSFTCGKTQNELTNDFNNQKFNSIQSLKEHLRLSDEIINVDNFIEKFQEFHKVKFGLILFPSFRLSCTMKLH